MTEPPVVGSLQVEQDMRQERREWRAERVGWVVFALILLAALLGLFGEGPLAKAQAGDEGSALWIDYARLERSEDASELVVHVGPEAVQEGNVRLSFNREYVDRMGFERIHPEPESQILLSDRIVYAFEAEATGGPLRITIVYQAPSYGSVPAQVAVEGGPTLEFRQFVYP